MNWETRSRKGGNAAYRKSLEDGQISMATTITLILDIDDDGSLPREISLGPRHSAAVLPLIELGLPGPGPSNLETPPEAAVPEG